MFIFSSFPDTSFCTYCTFPAFELSVADAITSPIPCVYSYVLLLYVLPEFFISLGAKYTNISFPFILYFAKFAFGYEKYPFEVWLLSKSFNNAVLSIIGILFITLLFLLTSSFVIVPEFSRLVSSIFTSYAILVFLIFSDMYFFSLSNSLEFTYAKSNTSITKNNTTKYPGITAKFFNTFPVLLALKAFNALFANITIINANIM